MKLCVRKVFLKMRRYISFFLIAFGLLGYAVFVPLVYFSNSAFLLLPSSLDDIDDNMRGIKEMMTETEAILSNVSSSIDKIIFTFGSFNFSQVIENFDSTLDSAEAMLNETINTLDSANKTLNDSADWLESLANDPWIRTNAPEVATEAENVVISMRTVAEILGELPIRSTSDSLRELHVSASLMLTHLQSLSLEINNSLQTYKTYVENVRIRIGDIKSSLDAWITNIQSIKGQIWILKIGVYGFLVYIILLHTAFLLIGLLLRKGKFS